MTDSARWDGFEFRPGDIVISTPPKCGTTWMQMMCAVLIFGGADLPGRLTEISPWLDVLTETHESVLASLAAQTHRRFIKTHTPLDGIPFDPAVSYVTVGRDPRDVAVSWDNHFQNLDLQRTLEAREQAVGLDDVAELLANAALPPEDPRGRYWFWIEDETPVTMCLTSLRSTLNHLDSFWRQREQPNVFLFHYADLQANPESNMRRLAKGLGIAVAEDRWPELLEATGFEAMRGRAGELAPQVKIDGFWKDPRRFFHQGRSGQWQEFMTPEEEPRYAQRVAAWADPDLAAWCHGGWSALRR
ncbi:MAG TPA: sulfotransferase domain-containing protein [Acidimicrobiales bacterium]|nr:sulfotransferase domain-containing protein [Acidimicrobiales bacterium]